MQNLPTIFRYCSKCVCVGNIFLKVWPFRMYPTFSDFSQCAYTKNIFLKVWPFIIYPTFSDLFPRCLYKKHFLEGVALQNLPTTFRIYPPPSEFTHHLHNLPTTFRIHPPPSEFTHHLQKKSVLRPLDLFGHFFQNPKIPKTSIFATKYVYERKL